MNCNSKFCEPCNRADCYYFALAGGSCGCSGNITGQIPNLEGIVRLGQSCGRFEELLCIFPEEDSGTEAWVIVAAVLGGIAVVLAAVAVGYRWRGEVYQVSRNAGRRIQASLESALRTSARWLRWNYGLQHDNPQHSDSDIEIYEEEVVPSEPGAAGFLGFLFPQPPVNDTWREDGEVAPVVVVGDMDEDLDDNLIYQEIAEEGVGEFANLEAMLVDHLAEIKLADEEKRELEAKNEDDERMNAAIEAAEKAMEALEMGKKSRKSAVKAKERKAGLIGSEAEADKSMGEAETVKSREGSQAAGAEVKEAEMNAGAGAKEADGNAGDGAEEAERNPGEADEGQEGQVDGRMYTRSRVRAGGPPVVTPPPLVIRKS